MPQPVPPSHPPDPRSSLDLALLHHRAGRLAEAAAIYRRILKEHPAHARAAHLLGLAAHQDGRLSEPLALIRHSLALDPAPGRLPLQPRHRAGGAGSWRTWRSNPGRR